MNCKGCNLPIADPIVLHACLGKLGAEDYFSIKISIVGQINNTNY